MFPGASRKSCTAQNSRCGVCKVCEGVNECALDTSCPIDTSICMHGAVICPPSWWLEMNLEMRFEGLSSYQQDYVKHPTRPRSEKPESDGSIFASLISRNQSLIPLNWIKWPFCSCICKNRDIRWRLHSGHACFPHGFSEVSSRTTQATSANIWTL